MVKTGALEPDCLHLDASAYHLLIQPCDQVGATASPCRLLIHNTTATSSWGVAVKVKWASERIHIILGYTGVM